MIYYIYGGFQKWRYPTTMGFPTKNDHVEVFWGYHHLRKHPYIYIYIYVYIYICIYIYIQHRPPPKTYITLEGFLWKITWVFRWPKPLLLMVLGVHGKYICIYIYLYLHLVDFLMVHVGKYTIHGSYGYIIIHPKPKKHTN